MHESQPIIEFLTRVLGRGIGADEAISLSSAQQGALLSFLKRKNINVNAARLSGTFHVADLFADKTTNANNAVDSSSRQNRLLRIEPAAASNNVVVGCDIQSIEEFSGLLTSNDMKSDPFVVDHFEANEIVYAENQPSPTDTLCGIFAAKEAIKKCMAPDTDLKSIRVSRQNGRPVSTLGEVSISHSREYATAVFVSNASGFTAGSAPDDTDGERVKTETRVLSDNGTNSIAKELSNLHSANRRAVRFMSFQFLLVLCLLFIVFKDQLVSWAG